MLHSLYYRATTVSTLPLLAQSALTVQVLQSKFSDDSTKFGDIQSAL